MATKKIITGNTTKKYDLVVTGYWKLEGTFSKWEGDKVTELKLTLIDYQDIHKIETVHYCAGDNTLEIHVFKGTSTTSTFTAGNSHLNGMTLGVDEKRNLDFIDYILDENPKLELCFKKKTGGAGNQPERKKGNIIQGISG